MCSVSVYVVFEDGETNHILKPFLNPLINHCFLIIPDGDRLIVSNKTIDKLEIYTLAKIGDILKNKSVIKIKPKKSKRAIMMNTCVGHVKQYLGVRNPFILTPYQLYRSLQNG